MAVWAHGRHLGIHRAIATPAPELGMPTTEGVELVQEGRPPGGGWRSHMSSLVFLAPAAIWLLVIVGYPLVGTIRDSFYDNSSINFVGLVNFLGLVFAVLTERIRWATAFKTIIFMPIAFSATASALVWNSIMDIDPHIGMVNATLQTVTDWFSPPGLYPVDTSAGQTVAKLASTGLQPAAGATLKLVGAQTAVAPTAAPGAVNGVVWRDFSPAHPSARGQIFPDEDGIAGLHLPLLNSDGSSAESASTDVRGDFSFSGISSGSYRVEVASNNFSSGFTGVYWLSGTQNLDPTSGLNQTAQALLSIPLVDLSMIIAYLWIWAGFAMVIIGAGLAALNREVLEAARIDGATEWQTFRRVTMPMLAPVLVVVFVTMIINVLKIFDIIINMAPSVSQANTLAVSLYNYGYASSPPANGLASAIAVILFILVVPVIYVNLKRIS